MEELQPLYISNEDPSYSVLSLRFPATTALLLELLRSPTPCLVDFSILKNSSPFSALFFCLSSTVLLARCEPAYVTTPWPTIRGITSGFRGEFAGKPQVILSSLYNHRHIQKPGNALEGSLGALRRCCWPLAGLHMEMEGM